jgi:hypothetical protein
MFVAPLELPVREHILRAGTHRLPFAIDLPPWMPSGYQGNDCGIVHRLETRLDVDWAIDPKETLEPPIVMSPREGVRMPVVERSPPGFHDSIVLEVSLASGVFAADEPLTGQIALRAGRDARFDAVVITLESVATVTMGRGDQRRRPVNEVRLPSDGLRAGEPIPFRFLPDYRVTPSFRNPFIDNSIWLTMRVAIPWSRDPEFFVPLIVLPAGSKLHGDASYTPVGSQRLRLAAAAMARETGLAEGRTPILVEGTLGPVRLRVSDAPRDGKIGVEAEFVFPDVELGTAFRPRHALDGFRESSLLTGRLAERFFLRAKLDEQTKRDVGTLASFFGVVLTGLEEADELRLSDQHLAAHFILADDDPSKMANLAAFLRHKAQQIAEAIERLPFPPNVAESLSTWRAAAVEQGAYLIPTGPSIHGLKFGAALLDGSVRSIGVAIRTAWTKAGPLTRMEIDLLGASVPDAACDEFEKGTGELVEVIRKAFPAVQVHGGSASLERRGFTADPRATFGAVESFMSWLLAARGERHARAPYR